MIVFSYRIENFILSIFFLSKQFETIFKLQIVNVIINKRNKEPHRLHYPLWLPYLSLHLLM